MLVPLLVPQRHTREDVVRALAAVAAMDVRERRRLLNSIDGAPLEPHYRQVLDRVLGPTPAGWS